ncbi:MAG: RidA family protein [Thermoplasmatota archaeon]
MKEKIFSKKAPEPLGPYSQAIKISDFEDLIFISGQIPINPETGGLIDDDITEATKQTLENIKSIIEESGASLDDVVKVQIYLKDLDDFDEMNDIYEDYFTNSQPARAAVEVSKIGLDAPIEIDAIVAL